MPILEINGRKIDFEKMPSEAEIDEVARRLGGSARPSRPTRPLRTQATEEEFLGIGQRLGTGFAGDPRQELARLRRERGLSPGTPLEPTGFNLRNLADFPADVVDAIGPAFPAIGQILAAIPTAIATKLPGPTIAAAGAGSAGGEAIRQFIGDVVFDLEQGTPPERVARAATEGAVGAGGEAIGIGIASRIPFLRNQVARVFDKTKAGLARGLEKIANRRGIDNAVTFAGRVFTNADPEVTSYAINQLRVGNKSILSRFISSPNFLMVKAKRVLFGGGNDAKAAAKQLAKIGSRGPDGRKSAVLLGRVAFDLQEDTVERIIRTKGVLKPRFFNRSSILNIAENVSDGTKKLFDEAGDEVKAARLDLATSIPDRNVSVSDLNKGIVDDLVNNGFLIPKRVGKVDGFMINERFAISGSGAATKRIFSNVIKTFFKERRVSPSDEAIKKAIISRRPIPKETSVLIPEKSMKFSRLVKEFNRLDSQLTTIEFERLGRFSPTLTKFRRGLNNRILDVAEREGDNSLRVANQKFERLAGEIGTIRQALTSNDPAQVEAFFRQILSANPFETLLLNARNLESRLRSVGVRYLDDLLDYNAAQKLSGINALDARTRLTKIMDDAFGKTPTQISRQALMREIDAGLPENLKLFKDARDHIAAVQLNRGAASLLRARFIESGLQIRTAIRPITGAALGSAFGGPVGATVGLAGGIALQDPRVLKFLVRLAARQRGVQAPRFLRRTTRQIPMEEIEEGVRGVGTGIAASELLRSLQRLRQGQEE